MWINLYIHSTQLVAEVEARLDRDLKGTIFVSVRTLFCSTITTFRIATRHLSTGPPSTTTFTTTTNYIDDSERIPRYPFSYNEAYPTTNLSCAVTHSDNFLRNFQLPN